MATDNYETIMVKVLVLSCFSCLPMCSLNSSAFFELNVHKPHSDGSSSPCIVAMCFVSSALLANVFAHLVHFSCKVCLTSTCSLRALVLLVIKWHSLQNIAPLWNFWKWDCRFSCVGNRSLHVPQPALWSRLQWASYSGLYMKLLWHLEQIMFPVWNSSMCSSSWWGSANILGHAAQW